MGSERKRLEYELNYDARGQLSSVEYPDGNSIEFNYDPTGELVAVTDTATGTRIFRVMQDWMMTGSDGSRHRVDGSVSVDQSTGCVVCVLRSGTRICTYPDGKTEVVTKKEKRHG